MKKKIKSFVVLGIMTVALSSNFLMSASAHMHRYTSTTEYYTGKKCTCGSSSWKKVTKRCDCGKETVTNTHIKKAGASNACKY